jgi:hypothetical protein
MDNDIKKLIEDLSNVRCNGIEHLCYRAADELSAMLAKIERLQFEWDNAENEIIRLTNIRHEQRHEIERLQSPK